MIGFFLLLTMNVKVVLMKSVCDTIGYKPKRELQKSIRQESKAWKLIFWDLKFPVERNIEIRIRIRLENELKGW